MSKHEVIILGVGSFLLTLIAWRDNRRIGNHPALKAFFYVLAAVPLLGPILYFFSNMPERLPRHLQAPPPPRGTQPYSITKKWIEQNVDEMKRQGKEEKKMRWRQKRKGKLYSEKSKQAADRSGS